MNRAQNGQFESQGVKYDEREAIDALIAHSGNIRKAAAALGIARTTLNDRVRKNPTLRNMVDSLADIDAGEAYSFLVDVLQGDVDGERPSIAERLSSAKFLIVRNDKRNERREAALKPASHNDLDELRNKPHPTDAQLHEDMDNISARLMEIQQQIAINGG